MTWPKNRNSKQYQKNHREPRYWITSTDLTVTLLIIFKDYEIRMMHLASWYIAENQKKKEKKRKNILRVARGNWQITIKVAKIISTIDFSSEIMEAKKILEQYSWNVERKQLSTKNSYIKWKYS